MESKALSRAVRVLMLLGSATLCGAAGGEISIVEGVAPLTPQAVVPAAALVQRVLATSASPQTAPIPDQDAAAPTEVQTAEASVGPKFISPRSLFQGDGFANSSSSEASLDGRRTAAAGLGLNVPLEGGK